MTSLLIFTIAIDIVKIVLNKYNIYKAMTNNNNKSYKLAHMQKIAKRCYGQLYIQDDNQDNLRAGWAFLLSSTYILTDAASVLNANQQLQTILFKIQIDGKTYERTCDAKAFPREIKAGWQQRTKQQFALLSLKQPIFQQEEQESTSSFVSLISESPQTSIEEPTKQLQNSKKMVQTLKKTSRILETDISLYRGRLSNLEERLADQNRQTLKLHAIIAEMKLELKQQKEVIKGLEDQSSLSLNISNTIFTNELQVNLGIVSKIKKTGKYSAIIFSLPVSTKTSFQCSCFDFKGQSPIIFGLITEGLLNRPFSTSRADEALSIRCILDPNDNQLQIRIFGQQKIIFEIDPSIVNGQSFKMKLSQSGDDVIFQMANQVVKIPLTQLSKLADKRLFPFIALFEESSSLKVKYQL